jgi:hypothetical protein
VGEGVGSGVGVDLDGFGEGLGRGSGVRGEDENRKKRERKRDAAQRCQHVDGYLRQEFIAEIGGGAHRLRNSTNEKTTPGFKRGAYLDGVPMAALRKGMGPGRV